ncbi:PGF-pre-PGF domain-containing protein [Methanosarcina acetivorans]|uniref:PGF-pre-PGF domain-containing protein n=1 Tax=Methanosarcina acetivorans TaxID=2214 RepID=UPI000689CFC0|nr:PGF-pre-PGF domain-containing protein [Methanosarcina acetivorans]
MSLKNYEDVSGVKIILAWASEDEEKTIENFYPLLKYTISGSIVSEIEDGSINTSYTNIGIQGNGMTGLGKSDEYGNYKFGNLSIDYWLEYGNYSLIAFKYIPSEGKYLFGTTNVSLNNYEDVSEVKIILDWASEDEEKAIENFYPLLKYIISGNVFSDVQDKTVNASDTNVVIQGNGMTGLGKSDEYGNYKFGNLSIDYWLEYGNYSLIAFKYIPSEGRYLFGTTNVSLKNYEEVSGVKIILDWASEDEEKTIENFYPLLKYTISGSIVSEIEDGSINTSYTNIGIQGNGMTGLGKSDEYGNYKFGNLSIDYWLEYGNYSLIAFKYIPSEGKYLFGTTNVSLNNYEDVSEVKIILDWASEDEEKAIENFYPLLKYIISGNVFSDVQDKTVNASDTNVVIQGNGMTGLGKSDEYGNYKFGNLSIDYWLEYGNYSLIAFKYIPPEGRYLFGTTNTSLGDIETVSDVNIILDWANEAEEKIIESFFPLFKYSFSGSVFSNIQNENINVSNTHVVIQGNGITGIRKCDDYGNYKSGDLGSDSWLEYGKNYSVTAFKYIPSQGKYLFGTTIVSLKNCEEVSDVNVELDWASGDEEKAIENFYPLLRYTISGSVLDSSDNSSSDNSNSDNSSGEGSSSDGSSSGSSHSSSGGGGSPEPARNVEVRELSQAFITNGQPVRFDLTRNATSVVYVSFDAKKTAGKTTTVVEMLKNKSTLTPDALTGEVYNYLNIWVGNGGYATEMNIENATVCFKVEKSWIQDKGIDQSSIILNRYSDKKWNELPTTLLGKDDKYMYFTAKTPEFSPFAIAGKTIVDETGNVIATTSKTQENKQNNTTLEIEQTSEQRERSTPGFEMIYCVIWLLGLFLYRRR